MTAALALACFPQMLERVKLERREAPVISSPGNHLAALASFSIFSPPRALGASHRPCVGQTVERRCYHRRLRQP